MEALCKIILDLYEIKYKPPHLSYSHCPLMSTQCVKPGFNGSYLFAYFLAVGS